MQKRTFVTLVALCSAMVACKAPDSVASRIAAQNALFEETYQTDLANHPERATAIGDYRYNDKLDEYSPASYQRQHSSDESYLSRLNAISTEGFPEQDALSHEVLHRSLTQRIANFNFKEFEMPVNQMDGPHVRLA